MELDQCGGRRPGDETHRQTLDDAGRDQPGHGSGGGEHAHAHREQRQARQDDRATPDRVGDPPEKQQGDEDREGVHGIDHGDGGATDAPVLLVVDVQR